MVTPPPPPLPRAPHPHRPPSAPPATSVPALLAPPPEHSIPHLPHLPPLHLPGPPLPPANAPAVTRVPDAPVSNTLPPLAISPTPSSAPSTIDLQPSAPPPLPVAKEAMFKAKRSSKSISHAEKRRLCELHDQNPNAKHGQIARLFQAETGHRIERSTVSRVLQRKEYWKGKASEDANRKRLASPRFPTVEEALYELIRHQSISRLLRKKLGDKELMAHSKEVANTLSVKHGSVDKNSPNYTPLLESFRGSLSWIGMFRKRNCLLSDAEAKALEGKSHSSASGNGETPDIWHTQLDIAETKDILSNWTRYEDIYFLEATVLATNALPQHATEGGPGSQKRDLSDDEGTGNGSNPRNVPSEGPSANGGLFPPINFALPPMSTVITGPTTALVTIGGSAQQHSSGIQGDLGATPSLMDTTTNDSACAPNLQRNRHPVDEDSMAIVLLSANGTASDRRTPWVVGKKPLRQVGTKEGEVWHDCDVRYFNNVRGWLTSRVLREWVKEFDASLSRNVALVTSLLSASDTELLDLNHVTVVSLPRMERTNDDIRSVQWRPTSSPINHGIEEVFRSKYRSLIVEKAIECITRNSGLRPMSPRASSALIKEAWDKVPLPLMRRAWRDLAYLPSRLLRTGSQQRGNAKSLTDQRTSELTRVIRAYKKALESSIHGQSYGISASDLQLAIEDSNKYVWLACETSVFHPEGKVIDFVQSVCSAELPNEPTSDDDLDINGATKKFPPICTYEEAVRVANSLAEFMRKDEALKGGQSLYHIGSLQLELKKVCDRKRDLAQARSWSG